MKNGTIIVNGQSTVRLQAARELVKDKENVYEACGGIHEAIRNMPINTEVIILEASFASDILNAIRLDFLRTQLTSSKEWVTIKVPDLVITTCISIDFIEQIQATKILKSTQTI